MSVSKNVCVHATLTTRARQSETHGDLSSSSLSKYQGECGHWGGPYLVEILKSTHVTHYELPMASPRLDISIKFCLIALKSGAGLMKLPVSMVCIMISVQGLCLMREVQEKISFTIVEKSLLF